jgi:Lysophospholipase L1 and related esterases
MSDSEPKRILAYGDSLTWGWIPVHVAPPSRRSPINGRWPGVMQAALGTGYEVIEAGLNGRTTDIPDPTAPQISGSGLDAFPVQSEFPRARAELPGRCAGRDRN